MKIDFLCYKKQLFLKSDNLDNYLKINCFLCVGSFRIDLEETVGIKNGRDSGLVVG